MSLTEKIRKTSLGGQFMASKYTGQNESGMQPINDNVLVLIDDAAEMSEGKVLFADETKEHYKAAAEMGVVVAVADGAFMYNSDRSREYTGRKPKPGDRVFFSRYGGQIIIGLDGKEYRNMTDKTISGIEIDTD